MNPSSASSTSPLRPRQGGRAPAPSELPDRQHTTAARPARRPAPSAQPVRPHDPEELLEALDPDQRAVAEHLEGPMCVLAGAGTGKTRAITYRIAYGAAVGVYQPTQVLAVTFTQRAAGEMRSRLADLGVGQVQARTFHSAALRQLDYFYPTVIGGRRPQLQESKAALVGVAARRMGLPSDRALIRDLAAEVEWAKVTMTRPEVYAERAAQMRRTPPGGLDGQMMARVYDAYEEAKTDNEVIDFEDVLLLMVAMLRSREDVAAQVRGQYKHFVVDEYQDVSPLQHRLLQLWLGPRRSQLCVVGDVSQTIYSFTGATPRFLTGFEQEFPGARTLQLTRDYRSTPQVVSLANRVLSRTKRSGKVTLPAGAVELVAQRPDGPAVCFDAYDDDVAEAAGVVAHVQRLHEAGVAWSQMAVLYRTSAQALVIEQALAEAGIGRVVRGGAKFFERDEVRAAMRALRGALTRVGDLSGDVGQDVRMVLGTVGWAPQPPSPRGAMRERWDCLNALVELADEMANARGADLGALIRELDERAQAQNAPTVDGVTLSTIHAAKGLEWDAVIVVGVTDGLLPISLAEGAQAIEEERRLLYVAVTRAREHLMLSYARARNVGARAVRTPSRFLTGIWPSEGPTARTGAAKSAGKSTSASKREAARQFEEENDPATVALFEQLRVWRTQVAKEKSIPAYVVFADSTLRLIAIIKPQTLPQLVAIHGVGPSKIEQYGADVLRVVREAHE